MLTVEQYTSRVDRIYERVLRARMTETLTDLAATFREGGYDVRGPYDLSDAEYRWFIVVEGNGLPESVDVSLELAESLSYGEETEGVNIGLSIVAYGGRVLGGLAPYNYTPEVWASVKDVHEIVSRMEIIARADPWSAVALVDDYANEGGS